MSAVIEIVAPEVVEVATNERPLVKLEGVHKTYDLGEVQVHALRGIDLTIEPGEFVAIMGSSGSGKSTLMNLLGCLDRPTRGRYYLDGEDVSKLDKRELAHIRNRKLGFVFQGFNLLSRTSALENVELPALYARLDAAERTRRAREALRIVGLAERAHHHPNQLSGGQQQRVAIARALMNHPALLLADEPTGNLDSRTSVEIMEIFQQLNDPSLATHAESPIVQKQDAAATRGMTLILVTHEPDVARYAKRIISFRDGKIRRDERVTDRLIASDVLKSWPRGDADEEASA